MLLRCPGCSFAADVPAAQLPPPGTKAKCPQCQAAFTFTAAGLSASDPDATPPHGTEAPAPDGGWRVRTVHGEQEALDIAAVREMIRAEKLVAEDEAAPPGQVRWQRAGDVKELSRYFALKTKAAQPPPADSPAGLAACSRHATARGAWLCRKCQTLWCDACAVPRQIGVAQQFRICPSCGEACSPLAPPKTAPKFHEDMKGLLVFPFRGFALIGVILCAIVEVMIAIASAAAFYGLIAGIILNCCLFAYLLFIVRHGANGKPGLPDLGQVGDIWSDMVAPGLKGLLVSVVVLLPLFSYQCFVMPQLGVFKEAEVEIVDGVDLNDRDLNLTEQQKSEARQRATFQQALEEAAASSDEGGEDFAARVEELAAEGMGEEPDASASSAEPIDESRPDERPLTDAEIGASIEAEGGWTLARQLKIVKPIHILAHVILIIYALILLPMLWIIVALFNTIAPALNPAVVFQVMIEVKGEYVRLVAFVGLMFLASALLSGPLLEIRYAGIFLSSLVSYAFYFVAFHAMGRFARWMDCQVDLT